jgi:hypothetical protein
MKKILIVSIIGLFLFSCGYKIAGFSDKPAFKIFIDKIVNNYKESDYTAMLNESVTYFFNSYNMLTEREKSDYILEVTLLNVKLSTSIKSATEETVSTDMTVEIEIKVNDKSGKVVFNKKMSSSETYNSGKNVSEKINNRNKTFRIIINNILHDFKNEFEEKK